MIPFFISPYRQSGWMVIESESRIIDEGGEEAEYFWGNENC